VTLYTEGFSRFVTSTTAPIVTGRSESCRVGLSPTERSRLFTAHEKSGLDFERGEIVVRDGKGAKDRVSVLPKSVLDPLRSHLDRVQALHRSDLADGFGEVYLPFGLSRKFLNGGREWA
jgi:hypothetical protein